MPQAVSTCGILIGAGLLIWSLVSYLAVFRRMVRQKS
jgi:uncharacterized integral membrane protein